MRFALQENSQLLRKPLIKLSLEFKTINHTSTNYSISVGIRNKIHLRYSENIPEYVLRIQNIFYLLLRLFLK